MLNFYDKSYNSFSVSNMQVTIKNACHNLVFNHINILYYLIIMACIYKAFPKPIDGGEVR